MTLERVGFIGLGAMGAPMAARLVAVVGTLTVFDPVAERRQSLADRGAVSAQSPLQAAREADALFVMVVNEVQCEEAWFGSEGAVAALPKNAVIVIMSTVGPQVVRGLAERLHRRGVQLVDAPVSGGVARAGAGDLLIMASGPASALDVVRPALTRMGSTVIDCGMAAGDGQAVKLVNQLLCGVHIAAAGEALGYARALGLSPAAVYETIRHGAAGSFMLEDRGARMLSREFTPAKSGPSTSLSRAWGWSLRQPRDGGSLRRWRRPRTNSSSSGPLRATPARTTQASCACSSSSKRVLCMTHTDTAA